MRANTWFGRPNTWSGREGWGPWESMVPLRVFAIPMPPESIFPLQRLRIAIDLSVYLSSIIYAYVCPCVRASQRQNALGTLHLEMHSPGHSRPGGVKVDPGAPKIQLFTWHQGTKIRPRSGQSGVQTVPNDGFQRPEAAHRPWPAAPVPFGACRGGPGTVPAAPNGVEMLVLTSKYKGFRIQTHSPA